MGILKTVFVCLATIVLAATSPLVYRHALLLAFIGSIVGVAGFMMNAGRCR